MNWIEQGALQIRWGRHVVGDTAGGKELCRPFLRLPGTQHLDEKIVGEAREEHLADQEEVGGQGGLKHDWHIRGVEEPNGVRASHAALLRGLDGYFNPKALQVDDCSEDHKRSKEVHHVGQVLSEESFSEGDLLVRPGQEQVELLPISKPINPDYGRQGLAKGSIRTNAMTAPSNSGPLPVLIVVGLKAFQTILSQMFVAMKRLIPLPNPYPFCNSSSSRMTISPANINCTIKSTQIPAPRSLGAP